ncbi:two-component sensor histidine kinase [Paenibacillus sp. H1-7]|nr:two-component sensor histidine kinase [Paenibacillus sp. H1-7]
MAGFAVTGQTLMLGGRPYALFIQAEALSLFHDYGKQLLTVVVDLLLFYIVILCATPARKKQMQALKNMVAAIRKIARGDFNVTFTALHNRGPWGELSQSLNHMAVELNQMEQMRQEFISNVSHEIQSPLTSISGFARALRNEQLNPEERLHYLDIIETESKRLSKLSDNLLKLTSLESNHHPYEPKPYRLDKQLRRIVLACEPQWLDKAIDMDVDLEEVTVHADEDMLSQVWVNLINNCIKFTPDKGTIGIHLQRLADSAVIRITDTGIGIAQEDLEHIFERFYKADKSRNRSGTSNGSGLGLSIVKKIVEMHHGSIQVQSRLGEGTTFTVTLPISS